MSVITVVATIIAKTGHEAAVEKVLLDLIPPSRKDPGFIQYDLHRDLKNPAVFIFYENWQSQEHLNQHLATPHLMALEGNLEGLLEKLEINVMEKISD